MYHGRCYADIIITPAFLCPAAIKGYLRVEAPCLLDEVIFFVNTQYLFSSCFGCEITHPAQVTPEVNYRFTLEIYAICKLGEFGVSVDMTLLDIWYSLIRI